MTDFRGFYTEEAYIEFLGPTAIRAVSSRFGAIEAHTEFLIPQS